MTKQASNPKVVQSLINKSRREFCRLMSQYGASLPLLAPALGSRIANAAPAGVAERVIFFYFPNGVAPEKYFSSGNGSNINFNYSMKPLEPFKEYLTLFKDLRLSGPEEDGHPNGAMRVLTGKTNGKSISMDVLLADYFASQTPVSHIHLGIQSEKLVTNQHDIMISRYSDGQEKSPQDNPVKAYEQLFGKGDIIVDDSDFEIMESLEADLRELQQIAGAADQVKLAQHAKAISEVKKRTSAAQCSGFQLNGFDESRIFDDSAVPEITKLQIDNMVQAMACGLSKVGTIQLSHHTGDHVMDWDYLAGTEDQSNHGASHNDANIHSNQVKWYMEQVSYLLGELQSRNDPFKPGTMLDNSIVVVLTEISHGEKHTKHPMPFFTAGKGSGALNTGIILDCKNAPHSNMLISVANAMGNPLYQFGDDYYGALDGFLS